MHMKIAHEEKLLHDFDNEKVGIMFSHRRHKALAFDPNDATGRCILIIMSKVWMQSPK